VCDADLRDEAGKDHQPMINQLLSSDNLRAVPRMGGSPAKQSVGTDRVGRMIQITLAIYLVPVLLVVVVVSGVGMMILGVSETLHGLSERVKRVTHRNGRPGFYR
jgi:hypothetical protein